MVGKISMKDKSPRMGRPKTLHDLLNLTDESYGSCFLLSILNFQVIKLHPWLVGSTRSGLTNHLCRWSWRNICYTWIPSPVIQLDVTSYVAPWALWRLPAWLLEDSKMSSQHSLLPLKVQNGRASKTLQCCTHILFILSQNATNSETTNL